MTEKEKFMKLALKEAQKAWKKDEVPIGCVIVKDGKVIARGHNMVESKKDSTCHAEIVAIKKAQKVIGDWRLSDCELYISMEPCCACAGAISNARVKKVYFGGYDKVFGGVESVANVLDVESSYWKVPHEGGILQEQCVKMLKDFFMEKRKSKWRLLI